MNLSINAKILTTFLDLACLDPPHTWKIYNISILHTYTTSLIKYDLSTLLAIKPYAISELYFSKISFSNADISSLLSLISSIVFAGKDALSIFIQSKSLIQTESLPATSKSETGRVAISAIMSSLLTNTQSFG